MSIKMFVSSVCHYAHQVLNGGLGGVGIILQVAVIEYWKVSIFFIINI